MFSRKQLTSYSHLAFAAVLLWSGSAFADDDYTAGLTAFIGGNYELAQAHWIKSAKKENSRAMFNLGLLHDQAKIANADPDKATRWYRLAGKAGYAAADYHHATRLIENKGDPQQIQKLLERAASNGYEPAKTRLASLTGKQSADSVVAARGSTTKNVSTPISNKAYLDEKWLLAQNSSRWTIQLLAFQDKTKVKEFIDTHKLLDQAAYFVDAGDSGILYKLVYGTFASKEEADQARSKLSTELQENGPWLRTMAGIQKIIKK